MLMHVSSSPHTRNKCEPRRGKVMPFILASCVLGLAGCATNPSLDSDPLEGFNRVMYGINDGLDKVIIGPVAKGYEVATPKLFRKGVGNFLDNLESPVVLANDILQLKPMRAATTTGRFLVNTTVGVGGVWDAASHIGLPEGHSEDFGQTLGYWGVPEGPYIVLPLIGPSTLRDGPAEFVDTFFDPLSYLKLGGSPDIATTVDYTTLALEAINGRVELDEQIEILRDQPEPYTALRRIHLMDRRADIRDGVIDEEAIYDDLPDFDDAFDESPLESSESGAGQ